MSARGDLVNLMVAIARQADRVGVEHEGVDPIGVVVRIADVAASVVSWAGEKGAADAQRDEALGFIDRTIDNGEGGTWHWTNAEVMDLLAQIRAMLVAEAVAE